MPEDILFEKNIFINFGDADSAGILFYPRAFEIAHECLESFWKQSVSGWAMWFQNHEFAVPIRHAECDYSKPLVVGENYQARLILKKIGESSVVFTVRLEAVTGVCAEIITTHVFIDKKNGAKVFVPKNIREMLTKKFPG